MKKVSLAALLLVAATVLGATVLREPVADAAQAPLSVFVNNDSSHPVPVAETNKDAGGNIKVHEQGTAAVRSGEEEVSISRFAADSSQFCESLVYTVPAGKQLVVEYLGAWVQTTQGATAARGNVNGTPSGQLPNDSLLPILFERQDSDIWSASDAVHFVFPAGREIRFTTSFPGATSCGGWFSLGGYLQPAS
jgi:hypothetical protein